MNELGTGLVEVICGSMFSGKTEEMFRRLRLARIAKQVVQLFRPEIDTRGNGEFSTHGGVSTNIEYEFVKSASEIFGKIELATTVVGIDEAQFFDGDIVEVVERLANTGKRVIINGLDMNFRGEPFGSMPILMSKADKVDKLQAICMTCGQPASRTQRIVNGKPAKFNDPVVIVGASELYEARCRQHHEVPRE